MDKLRVAVDIGGSGARLYAFTLANKLVKSKKVSLSSDISVEIKRFLKLLHLKNPRILIGSRGVWTSGEKQALRKQYSAISKNISVMSDIELAHHLTFGPHQGIMLNAGTGSIAFGRASSGKTARAGGLGPLLGDEGSGFWMGKEWLKANWTEKRQLDLRSLARHPRALSTIASYASRALNGKDQASKSIIDRAITSLMALVIQIDQALKLKKKGRIALAGGLFKNPRFRSRFEKRLREEGFNQRKIFSSKHYFALNLFLISFCGILATVIA